MLAVNGLLTTLPSKRILLLVRHGSIELNLALRGAASVMGSEREVLAEVRLRRR